MSTEVRPGLTSRTGLFALLVIAACTLIIVCVGWISDDAYITARYADNLLNGYGPVFNVGERVQGYTHPLWLLLFTPALAVMGEPLLVAVTLGAIFTALTLWLVYRLLADLYPRAALPLFAAFVGALLLSESWRSFQTSGLENPLSHLLIAATLVELVRHPELRLGRVTALCSLLALTRPDFAVLVGPLGAVCFYAAYRRRQPLPVAAGLLPFGVWLAFAWAYYGTVIPNTATSKLGIYSPLEAVGQGLVYVLDWIYYEPASAFMATACLVVIVRTTRRPAELALLIGALLYLAGVIVGAGDFMRGRMILPLLFYLTLAGAVGLARLASQGGLAVSQRWVIAVGAVVASLVVTAPAQAAGFEPRGIVNERLFYKGQWFTHYLVHGEIRYGTGRISPEVIAELKGFSEICGTYGFHEHVVGGIGYYIGPQVKVIDTIGLTDRYVAHLPNSYLLHERPRPGHPTKRVPVAYLAERADIRLFSNWRSAVQRGDCDIIEAARQLGDSDDFHTEVEQHAVYK